MQDVDKFLNAYTMIKFGDTVVIILILVVTWPQLVYKMYNYHRSEFKEHGVFIVLYFFAFLIFNLSLLDTYVYLITHIIEERDSNYNYHHRLPHSYICFSILGYHHFIVPAIIILLKKNDDLFVSFSKIDCQAKVSMF